MHSDVEDRMHIMAELATSVPSAVQARGEQRVYGLPPLGHLVFKIIVVLGGFGETALVRHLLNQVPFVKGHYDRLCQAFRQTHLELCNQAREETSQGMWLVGVRGIGHGTLMHKCADDHDIDVLLIVLQELQEKSLIQMDGEGVQVWCEDFLLVDQLYQSLSFAHRRELHKEATRWMREASDKEELKKNAAHIIHHTMMSQDEKRVPHILQHSKRLDRSATLEDQIVLHVRWYLDAKDMNFPRAQKCLRAIPFLRGLAKAMDQQRVGEKVTSIGNRLVQSQRKKRDSISKVQAQNAAAAPVEGQPVSPPEQESPVRAEEQRQPAMEVDAVASMPTMPLGAPANLPRTPPGAPASPTLPAAPASPQARAPSPGTEMTPRAAAIAAELQRTQSPGANLTPRSEKVSLVRRTELLRGNTVAKKQIWESKSPSNSSR